MRKILFAVTLVALAGTFAASAATPTVPVPADVSQVDGLLVAPEPAALCSDGLATAEDVAALFRAPAIHCEPAPHCRNNRDCASFCGDPQFGLCRDGCCVCTG